MLNYLILLCIKVGIDYANIKTTTKQEEYVTEYRLQGGCHVRKVSILFSSSNICSFPEYTGCNHAWGGSSLLGSRPKQWEEIRTGRMFPDVARCI